MTKTPQECPNHTLSPSFGYQCGEFEVTTLQEALEAYQAYVKAEAQNLKTISWIVSSVGYFSEFLGPENQNVSSISVNDMRQFIIYLQEKPKFSNHPFSKPQKEKQSLARYFFPDAISLISCSPALVPISPDLI
jgi:hypothetical protein